MSVEYDGATSEQDSEVDSFPPPRFVNIDDVQPGYVNYIHVLQDQYAFHVIFSQITPPVIRNDEDRDALVRDGFAAAVVARLIVAPNAMRDFISVLTAQLQQFEAGRDAVDPDILGEERGEGVEDGS